MKFLLKLISLIAVILLLQTFFPVSFGWSIIRGFMTGVWLHILWDFDRFRKLP